MSELYDVIVVGGGAIGLSAAFECAVKRGKKVLLIEQFKIGNEHGSSSGFSRQWRICYSEMRLCKLAIKTSQLWDRLQVDLKNDTLLSRTGLLWFGDPTVHQTEGTINGAERNLEALGEKYEVLDKAALKKRFPFISNAVGDLASPKGLFVHDGGTIDVPGLIHSFSEALKISTKCDLLEEAVVTSIDHSSSKVIVSAKKAGKTYDYRGKKVILTPGIYVNSVLSTLKPVFPNYINYNVYLFSSTSFHVDEKQILPGQPDPKKWPIWVFFGKPKKTSGEEPVDSNTYYGFPSVHDDCAQVAPRFASKPEFEYRSDPPPIGKRPIDHAALQFTSEFVRRSLPALDSKLIPGKESSYPVGFAALTNGKKMDKGAGFVLDFVPNTNNRIVLATGGSAMKLVPAMGLILADLAIDGKTSYSEEIEPMNISRGILVPREPVAAMAVKREVNLLTSAPDWNYDGP
jgi:glycine/D-amino acid oxidase-like deaminating enzyme